MRFKFFNKKEEVLDLRKPRRRVSEIPVSNVMQKKIEGDIANFSVGSSVSSNINSGAKEVESAVELNKSRKSNAVGFFSGFFGGGSSNSGEVSPTNSVNNIMEDSSSNSVDSVSTENVNGSSNSSYSSYYANRNKARSVATIKTNLEDLSDRINRLVDRIELLERKVNRLEGR